MKEASKKYIRTDIASEGSSLPESSIIGVDYSEQEILGTSVVRLHIKNEDGARALEKPIGHYVTVAFDLHGDQDEILRDNVVSAVSGEIRELALKLCDKKISSVLVAGLGNRRITSDSIGPLCTDSINITRHLGVAGEKKPFPEISAISPGVLAQTGIETLDLIKGAANSCNPSLVIIVDALAARSIGRLASTVQISDAGISPGSGIGNHRKKIDSESIGFPVMAIGVPTVVDSATLVLDALERAGICEYPESLIPILEEGSSFFVTLKDSDLAVCELSEILYRALNDFFDSIGE